MTVEFENTNVKSLIIEILNRVILDEPIVFSEEMCNKDLLGKEIRLKARDLLKLYFEVKSYFQIKVSEEAVVEGKFRTINEITLLVEEALNFNSLCI